MSNARLLQYCNRLNNNVNFFLDDRDGDLILDDLNEMLNDATNLQNNMYDDMNGNFPSLTLHEKIRLNPALEIINKIVNGNDEEVEKQHRRFLRTINPLIVELEQATADDFVVDPGVIEFNEQANNNLNPVPNIFLAQDQQQEPQADVNQFWGINNG